VTSSAATLTVVPPSNNAAPVATITAPVEGRLFRGGQTIRFRGVGADAEDGRLRASSFSWGVELHRGDEVQTVLAAKPGIRTGTFRVPRDAELPIDAFFRITLTVTDSASESHATTRDVAAETVTVTVSANQPGLAVRLDGQSRSTPFAFEAIAGTRHRLAAEASQVVDGVNYTFRRWAHRRAAEFDLIVPASDRFFEVVYERQL
jgi:hypothetical protein